MTYSLLIVDDDPLSTRLLTFLLTDEGYAVAAVHTPTDALALLTHTTYALLLLDVMLPEMDGFELCRRIRQKAATPIIFISASGDTTNKRRAIAAGGDDYLSKPFDPHDLLARIRALVGRASCPALPGAALPRAPDLHVSRCAGAAKRG